MLQDAGEKEEDLGEGAVVLAVNLPMAQKSLPYPFSTSIEKTVLPALLRSFGTTAFWG